MYNNNPAFALFGVIYFIKRLEWHLIIGFTCDSCEFSESDEMNLFSAEETYIDG